MTDLLGRLTAEILARAATDPDSPAWKIVWRESVDQGEGVPGSEVLLPWLAVTAAAFRARGREDALILGGSLARDVPDRETYAADIAALRAMAAENLARASGDDAFVYLQQALLGYDDDPWAAEVDRVIDGEADAECPGCGETFLVALDREEVEAGLHGRLATRLHGEAVAAGREDVARRYTYLFGRVTCPECDARFDLADAI